MSIYPGLQLNCQRIGVKPGFVYCIALVFHSIYELRQNILLFQGEAAIAVKAAVDFAVLCGGLAQNLGRFQIRL